MSSFSLRSILPNSLAFRLLAVIAIWTVSALLITGIVLTTLFRQNAEQDFRDLLLAHTYNLMGAIDVEDSGHLVGSPNLGDPRFLSPSSGWYWAVSNAAEPKAPLIHSPSIAGELADISDVTTTPFNEEYRRVYTVLDADGHNVQRLEAQLFVGEDDTLYQVMVAANRDDLENRIRAYQQSLWSAFGLFGAGTIVATWFVIGFGLRPLKDAKLALTDVREGHSDSVQGEYPREVSPLVGEINALIDANRSVMERARMQVGNLAHGLKTPLAVIANETRDLKTPLAKLVSDQAENMQDQVQTYLNRARIAAQRGTLTARAKVKPVVDRIERVVGRLAPHCEIKSQVPDLLMFAGEGQDLEEVLGNLVENAARFAQQRVDIRVDQLLENSPNSFQLVIEDDGPGVSPDMLDEILKRGKRLDETMPGSGLGLSIVKDIVDEYGGSLELSKSSLGGLCVVVILPQVVAR